MCRGKRNNSQLNCKRAIKAWMTQQKSLRNPQKTMTQTTVRNIMLHCIKDSFITQLIKLSLIVYKHITALLGTFIALSGLTLFTCEMEISNDNLRPNLFVWGSTNQQNPHIDKPSTVFAHFSLGMYTTSSRRMSQRHKSQLYGPLIIKRPQKK